ncbi:MAG TPA: toxin-antitoxin system HicB family antitoxin [Candidatus Margulisbacteria bacterium]|nr:toxin-antitoxin system HicB family antitoxin [Candidatus Margulisiibacteriota bacterium]
MQDVIQYKDFIGSIHYDSDDEIFYGKVLGVDDLVTFEGDCVSALKSSFIEAVEDYIQLCKEVGKDPVKSYKGSFNVRVPVQMHRQAALKAQSKGLKLNDFVKKAIEHELSRV